MSGKVKKNLIGLNIPGYSKNTKIAKQFQKLNSTSLIAWKFPKRLLSLNISRKYLLVSKWTSFFPINIFNRTQCSFKYRVNYITCQEISMAPDRTQTSVALSDATDFQKNFDFAQTISIGRRAGLRRHWPPTDILFFWVSAARPNRRRRVYFGRHQWGRDRKRRINRAIRSTWWRQPLYGHDKRRPYRHWSLFQIAHERHLPSVLDWRVWGRWGVERVQIDSREIRAHNHRRICNWRNNSYNLYRKWL